MSSRIKSPILQAEDRHSDWSSSLPACFERVVEQYGSRLAIASEAGRLTYSELNVAANRLAHKILRRDGAAGDRIAILMAPDGLLIAAVLGVLKAGRIVIVLNSTEPVARMRQLLADAEPAVIVTDAPNHALAQEIAIGCDRLRFDDQSDNASIQNPCIQIAPDDAAILIYTSGSTGQPKAVVATHRQILLDAPVYPEALDLTADDRVCLLGSLTFAQGAALACATLLTGASLYPFPVMLKGVTGLADWMRENRISIYVSSTSIFRAFMKSLDDGSRIESVRAIRLASEPATSDDFELFRKHFPMARAFVHSLASSETLNIALIRRSPHDDPPEGRLAVGTPSKGQQLLIVDEQGQPVAPGEVGEIIVKSRSLAAGYWRNPALTAERFSAAGDGSGMRLFRTGDLGRVNGDGLLEHFGRKDSRVKIRGNRIEPAEIETALRSLAGVTQVAVEVIERDDGDPLLAAYVVPEGDAAWSPIALRRALRSTLPLRMIPSRFVVLDELPLTPSGKLDRMRLRTLRSTNAQGAHEAPVSASEKMIAELWRDAFGIPEVGRWDDFFDLGGDSLIAAVIAAKIHAACGVELEFRSFADHPTLAGLAALVDKRAKSGATDAIPLMPVSRDQALPISLFQELTWRLSQTEAASATHVFLTGYRIAGRLDRLALQQCMTTLAERHEMLRTTFAESNGQAVQLIHPAEPVELPFIDLVGVPNAQEKATQFLHQEGCRVLDLSKAPLIRWSLVRMRNEEHWLLCAAHHILLDAWSMDLYLRELGTLYEAKMAGTPAPFASQRLQYADYAVWQRNRMRPGMPAYDQTLAWWRRTLSRAPAVLDLPFVRTKPISGTKPEDGFVNWGISKETTARLDEIARRESATYYVVRLAAYVAMLAATTGQRDMMVGSTATNRQRGDLQSIFGFFLNHVMLRFRFEPDLSFRQWIAIVRRVVLETGAYADMPYSMLRKALLRRGVVMPATDATFAVSRHRVVTGVAGLTIANLNVEQRIANHCFNLHLDEYRESSNCVARFDAGWYDKSKVQDFIEQLKHLLDAASRHPDLSMKALFALSGIRQRERPGRLRMAYVVARRLRQRWRRVRQYAS